MKTLVSLFSAAVLCSSLAVFAQGHSSSATQHLSVEKKISKKKTEAQCAKEGKTVGTPEYEECVKAKRK
jgi:hypothetical protein